MKYRIEFKDIVSAKEAQEFIHSYMKKIDSVSENIESVNFAFEIEIKANPKKCIEIFTQNISWDDYKIIKDLTYVPISTEVDLDEVEPECKI